MTNKEEKFLEKYNDLVKEAIDEAVVIRPIVAPAKDGSFARPQINVAEVTDSQAEEIKEQINNQSGEDDK